MKNKNSNFELGLYVTKIISSVNIKDESDKLWICYFKYFIIYLTGSKMLAT